VIACLFATRFRLSPFAHGNYDFATTMNETWLGDGMREDGVVGELGRAGVSMEA
jgi:hypothetical protein